MVNAFNRPQYQPKINADVRPWEYDLHNQPGIRIMPGVKKSERMAQHGAAYNLRDPELLCYQPPPPPHLQAALEDVFGAHWLTFPDGDPRIKLAKHPNTKEWCLYQCVNRGLNLWHCFWHSRDEGSESYIPGEWRDDKYKAALGQYYGDVYEVSKDHFSQLSDVNIKQHGVDAVCNEYDREHDELVKETERVMELRDHDYLDYIWLGEVDRANREAGSGQKMRSFPFESELAQVKTRVQNWILEEVRDSKGNKLYTRKRNRTHVEYREAVIAEMVEALIAYEDKKGMQLYRTPEQLAARAEQVEANKAEISQAAQAAQRRGELTTRVEAVTNEHGSFDRAKLLALLESKKETV